MLSRSIQLINGTRIGISLFGGIYLKEKNLREQIR